MARRGKRGISAGLAGAMGLGGADIGGGGPVTVIEGLKRGSRPGRGVHGRTGVANLRGGRRGRAQGLGRASVESDCGCGGSPVHPTPRETVRAQVLRELGEPEEETRVMALPPGEAPTRNAQRGFNMLMEMALAEVECGDPAELVPMRVVRHEPRKRRA